MVGDSALFTYGAPFIGVLLVAIGIGAAVPGAYDLIQEDISTCGEPTIAVESAEQTREHFGDEPKVTLPTVAYENLSDPERQAFEEALSDPQGEAHIPADSPTLETFRNGSFVVRDDQRHYVTVVADNPCFASPPLGFPLGVFAIALGFVGILTPPAYRKLVELERGASGEE
jgi:hypothetical protein